jgi:hypothetical protein
MNLIDLNVFMGGLIATILYRIIKDFLKKD